MDNMPIDGLLRDLKNSEEAVRDRATQELWRLWFTQKGAHGLMLLERAQELVEMEELIQADELLTRIIADQPDFVEAWNRRAVLYYMRQEYRKSLQDCLRVVELNPIHFGALHGMGLCYAALGEYGAAIAAFHRALEIQPYAVINQRLILECTARLS